jgi:hypothetical protein
MGGQMQQVKARRRLATDPDCAREPELDDRAVEAITITDCEDVIPCAIARGGEEMEIVGREIPSRRPTRDIEDEWAADHDERQEQQTGK